jgi:hypothetical protein
VARLGRWASCDPTGLADGPNLYSYVQGRAIQSTDPRGTQHRDAEAWAKAESQSKPNDVIKTYGQAVGLAAGIVAVGQSYALAAATGGTGTVNAPRTPDEPRYKAMTNEEVAINAAAGASLGFYFGRILVPIVANEIRMGVQPFESAGAAPPPPKIPTPADTPSPAQGISGPATPKPAAVAGQLEGKAASTVSPLPGAATPVEPIATLPKDVGEFAKEFHASEGELLNNLASGLQQQLAKAGVKNPRLAVAVSAGVIDDKVYYVVTVSDRKALAILRQYEKYLPEGMKVGVSEPKFVGGKLDPLSHVEIAGSLELKAQGARGVVTGTNIPACKGNCEPLWAGESGTPPSDVWHTNRRK